MAITINQAPTYPNAVYTNLVYAVSSNLVNNPQFQYVMDIRSGGGGGPILARIRQYPNPAGVAIFDPSRILSDYLEYDTAFDKTGYWYPIATESDIQEFTMEFGEEYGTSPSSSVVLYDGNGNPGEPNVRAGERDIVFPGTIDPNNGVSYNWPYSGSAKLLTDRPSGVPLDTTQDFYTLTAYNGTDFIQVPLIVTSMDKDDSPVMGIAYPVTQDQFMYTNVGYNSQFNSPEGGLYVYYEGDTRDWPYDQDACNYERINFAFINNYGVWDFYGFNLPIKKNTNIKRKSFVKPFVDYSSALSPYNGKRRGTSVYSTSYMDNISVSTPYVTEEVANWLTQLIESPEVYLQEGTNMVPIVITNSNYTHNTNIRSQKAFQYEISYQYANQRQTR